MAELKALLMKIIATYAAHGKFYALVTALEMAAVSYLVSYSGGLPTNKSQLFAFLAGLGGAAWGAIKGWLVNYQASKAVKNG